MSVVRIGIVGMGKIATDEHVLAIAANPRFELAATVERSAPATGINFSSYQAMLAESERIDAVAITTPPGPRYAIAKACIEAGLHVLLEKPPTATLGEIEEVGENAKARGVSLFATWHAQHNEAVFAAKTLLAGRKIREMTVIWHENVEKWHPGQRWIWDAGGFGVFDPGINAFSILTRIFPASLFVREAALHYPRGAHTPIAAEIAFDSPASDGPLRCSLDWRRSAGEEWTISITTDDGTNVTLLDGGARLLVDGAARPCRPKAEYPDIYRRFAELIERGESEVDIAPLRLVADCLLVGSRNVLEDGPPA